LNHGFGEHGERFNPRKARVGWIIIISLLLAVAGGWWFTDFIGARARAELARDSEIMERVMFNRLNDLFKDTDQTVKTMSGSPWVPGAFSGDIAMADTVLDRYCDSHDLSLCYLVNLKGTAVAASNRRTPLSLVGKNYGFRPYFQAAAAGKPSRYFALGVTTGERGFYSAAPVLSGGRTVGVAVVKKNLDYLAGELREFPYMFLVSPEGVIFISSRADLIFRSLWPISAAARERLAKSNQFGAVNFEPLMNEEPLDDRETALAGDKFYVSRAPLGQDGWSLVAFNSTRPVRMARFSGVLVSFVFCLLLLFFFMVLIQSEAARQDAERLLALREEVKTLSGIVPICAHCKKIRDDKGFWNKVEIYVSQHTEAQFSHGLCPACAKALYPEYSEDEKQEGADAPASPAGPEK